MSEWRIGETYGVQYPFAMEKVEVWPDDHEATCMVEVDSWRPGVRFESDRTGENSIAVANGHGSMLLTVVDVHRPGRFPTRVFYTRQWRDPNGKVFGKGGLRITTAEAFRRLLCGYRHDYALRAAGEPAKDGR